MSLVSDSKNAPQKINLAHPWALADVLHWLAVYFSICSSKGVTNIGLAESVDFFSLLMMLPLPNNISSLELSPAQLGLLTPSSSCPYSGQDRSFILRELTKIFTIFVFWLYMLLNIIFRVDWYSHCIHLFCMVWSVNFNFDLLLCHLSSDITESLDE